MHAKLLDFGVVWGKIEFWKVIEAMIRRSQNPRSDFAFFTGSHW